MKKHSLLSDIVIFSVIFLLLIVPPFFTTKIPVSSTIFSAWTFPFHQLIFALIALLLYFFYYEKKEKKLPFFPLIMTTSLLFCFALFIKFFSVILVTNNVSEEVNVILPDSVTGWCFCLLNFAFAAFYEEVLYRFYFADQLQELLSYKIKGKYLWLVCEILACLAFAFAHFYLGIFSVINAILGHVILRLCYKKSGSIWTGFLAHFIYNVISLILL
ncbi:MAG: CPBP family intramembrane metalloprotease [Treponema sp.]|nr:CPBP family intramembrane metalloprotease [Treponema sp.]